MENQKVPLYYGDKVIGYAILDYEKNEIISVITTTLDEVNQLFKGKISTGIRIGFKEQLENIKIETEKLDKCDKKNEK